MSESPPAILTYDVSSHFKPFKQLVAVVGAFMAFCLGITCPLLFLVPAPFVMRLFIWLSVGMACGLPLALVLFCIIPFRVYRYGAVLDKQQGVYTVHHVTGFGVRRFTGPLSDIADVKAYQADPLRRRLHPRLELVLQSGKIVPVFELTGLFHPRPLPPGWGKPPSGGEAPPQVGDGLAALQETLQSFRDFLGLTPATVERTPDHGDA